MERMYISLKQKGEWHLNETIDGRDNFLFTFKRDNKDDDDYLSTLKKEFDGIKIIIKDI